MVSLLRKVIDTKLIDYQLIRNEQFPEQKEGFLQQPAREKRNK
jgi:hypothetical protein